MAQGLLDPSGDGGMIPGGRRLPVSGQFRGCPNVPTLLGRPFFRPCPGWGHGIDFTVYRPDQSPRSLLARPVIAPPRPPLWRGNSFAPRPDSSYGPVPFRPFNPSVICLDEDGPVGGGCVL